MPVSQIPVWGMCHRRVGNNVVLVDDTGGLTCYKCFNLVLRSSNVLQIHTAALDKCYTTEEKALADCPSDMSIREKRSREIMLYRKFNPAITNKKLHYSNLCVKTRLSKDAFLNLVA